MDCEPSSNATQKTVLSGDDYFYCERAKCRLRLEICFKRQIMNTTVVKANKVLHYDMCEKCEQGINNMKGNSANTTTSDVKTSEESVIRICKQCGEEPTISPKNPYGPRCLSRRSHKKTRSKTLKTSIHKMTKSIRPSKIVGHTRKKRQTGSANKFIEIDFSEHRDIFDQITLLSESEIRPLNCQVIYMLKEYLSKQHNFKFNEV